MGKGLTDWWQGSDHGYGSARDGEVFGNYAIYVSKDATTFPGLGYHLRLEVEVSNSLNFLLRENEDL